MLAETHPKQKPHTHTHTHTHTKCNMPTQFSRGLPVQSAENKPRGRERKRERDNRGSRGLRALKQEAPETKRDEGRDERGSEEDKEVEGKEELRKKIQQCSDGEAGETESRWERTYWEAQTQTERERERRRRMRDECWRSGPSIFLFCCHQLSWHKPRQLAITVCSCL